MSKWVNYGLIILTNVAHHVLAESIVCRYKRQRHLLKSTSQIVPLHPKTLKKYSVRRDNLDVEGQMETLWAFSGRLPRKDMKLVEVVKGLHLPIHLHIYVVFCILTMCRNAQVQYRQCHPEISSIS